MELHHCALMQLDKLIRLWCSSHPLPHIWREYNSPPFSAPGCGAGLKPGIKFALRGVCISDFQLSASITSCNLHVLVKISAALTLSGWNFQPRWLLAVEHETSRATLVPADSFPSPVAGVMKSADSFPCSCSFDAAYPLSGHPPDGHGGCNEYAHCRSAWNWVRACSMCTSAPNPFIQCQFGNNTGL